MRDRPHRDERGAVALLVAILSVVLFGAAAFVTDMGIAYSNQRDLQNGVDAAALAIGNKIAVTAKRTDDCTTLAAQWNGVPANTIAQPIFTKNDPSSSAALTGATVQCEPIPGFTSDQLVIHVTSTQTNSTTFGRIFGVNSLIVSRQARVITGNGLPYLLRPFGVCQADAQTLEDGITPTHPYKQHTVVFPNPSQAHAGTCGGANGNAGLLDLDGGGGGRGGQGACTDDVKHWISCGFNGKVVEPTDVPGQSGNFGGGDLDSYMAQLDGADFAIPVYTKITGNGNNASYHVTGFIVVELCGWDFQVTSTDAIAGSTHRYGCYNALEWTDSTTAAKATFGSQKMNFMQLQYVKTITPGELDKVCPDGDLSCSWATLVSKLAD